MSEPARVVVTVGTDHHPFDRLVDWIDSWSRANPEVAILLQRGESAPATTVDSVAMLPYDDLVAAMAGADVVIAQGGPAAIMDARSVGRRPIVVPRRGDLGEHVDDHQVRFATWMAERDLVGLAITESELVAQLERGLADPSSLRIAPDGGRVEATISAFAAVVDPLIRPGSGGGSPWFRRRRRRVRRR